MQYIIDDANLMHIKEVMDMGINHITANPSMYVKDKICLEDFLKQCITLQPAYLSAEIMELEYDEMKKEAMKLIAISNNLIIKINFSVNGLKLCNYLHKKGIKTAMTLVFTLAQVQAAIQAHADYIFFFIGRNDEIGNDGMDLIIKAHALSEHTASSIVAASIKHPLHLQQLCTSNIPYAAIPYDLYMKTLTHPLTEAGANTFMKDYAKIKD